MSTGIMIISIGVGMLLLAIILTFVMKGSLKKARSKLFDSLKREYWNI